MENLSLVDTFEEFKSLKNIEPAIMMSVLEDVFRAVLLKQFGSDENFDVIVNVEKGDLEIWRNREVVLDEDFDDPEFQITLTEAKKIDEDFEVGEDVVEPFKLEELGRRSILNLRQNLSGKILELEKESLYAQYKDRIGELVTGEIYQVWKREVLIVDDEQNESLLPKAEQIPGDYFRKGESIRCVIERVDMRNNTPHIILSRTSENFMRRLFELEVPEINDGMIVMHDIARVPGERAKVAVEAMDERIDPVGACVGMKGSRIHGIVRELQNENIDVINYTTNKELFIARALNPAKVSNMKINEDDKKVEVYLKPEEVSLAIGKGGVNIKLASALTGYEIDVFREVPKGNGIEEDDVVLTEFTDEIDGWVIEEIRKIGCDTAKSVLNLSREELVRRTDLEEETIDEVLAVLRAEFE